MLAAVRDDIARDGVVTVEFAARSDATHRGGLALYGARVGAYPVDPTLFLDVEG
jgi:hypothetical protein